MNHDRDRRFDCCRAWVHAANRLRSEDGNRIAASDAAPGIRARASGRRPIRSAKRAAATVYTSGEHGPMCVDAHG